MHNEWIQAVVFDFDGTLAEPAIDFTAMKGELAALARGYAPWAEDAGQTPALEWLEALAGELRRRDPVAARRLLATSHARIREIESEAATRARLFPFTRPVLAEFARLGVGTAVITRNCSCAVYAVFPDAREAAGVVLTRDDVRRVKPDPQHLSRALAALGAAPERAIMVGDHPLDMETGRCVGALKAGVLSGGSSRAALLEAGADFVVAGCSLLAGALVQRGLLPPDAAVGVDRHGAHT